MKNKLPRIGTHVSAAGGLLNAISNSDRLGNTCFQIHATSPRQWDVRFPKKSVANDFSHCLRTQNLHCYIHAPYLINLAGSDKNFLQKSIKNLAGNLKIAEMIGARGVVFHLGSAVGNDRKKSIDQQVALIRKILQQTPGVCKLILENAAGGGDKIGAELSEIAYMIKKLKTKRVGVCLDTAHLFEAGMATFDTKGVKKLVADIKKTIGLKNLICMHVNDSKTLFDSKHDRHENIGKGHIGINGFKNLAAAKELHTADWILENPGYGPDADDLPNVKAIRKCFASS